MSATSDHCSNLTIQTVIQMIKLQLHFDRQKTHPAVSSGGAAAPPTSSTQPSDGWPLKDANVREAADLPHRSTSQRQQRDASKSAAAAVDVPPTVSSDSCTSVTSTTRYSSSTAVGPSILLLPGASTRHTNISNINMQMTRRG